MIEGAEFFEDDEIFETYRSARHRPDSPNETLEKPVFLDLLDDMSGKKVLDLGCGDGMFGLELIQAGCQSYLGLEASEQMVRLARRNLQGVAGQILHTKIEDWHYPAERFDLAVSRLALHYVADLDQTFHQVYRALSPNGQCVFSIVHPVITACDKSREGGGTRHDWIVDDYFTAGPRQVHFMGESRA